MKTNSRIRIAIRKLFVFLASISLLIISCTAVSRKFGMDVYAAGTTITNVTVDTTPKTVKDIDNGISSQELKEKLSLIEFKVAGDLQTASGIAPTRITDIISTVDESSITITNYKEDETQKQSSVTGTGYLTSGTKDGTEYSFDRKEVTFNVTVNASPYTFVSVIDPDYEAVFPSKTSKDVITKALNENCPYVSIIVKNGSDKEEWAGVPVTWTGVKSGESYDPSSTDKQTVTWVGKVSKGSFRIESEGKNVNVPTDQTVEIKVIVGYDEYEESKMGGDYDDDDLGKIKTTISKSTVKKILDAQTDSKIKKTIEDAILAGKTLSIEVYVEKLDKDDVDDSIIDKFKDKADAKVGTICDIRLYLTVDGSRKNQITSPGQTLSFTHTIPSDLKKSSSSSNGKKYKRKFREYRYHDGSAHSCDEDWTDSDSPSSVKFKSSQFSYYALMYKDSETSSSSTSSSSRTGSSSIASARTPTTGGTSSGNAAGGSRTGSGAPKTGDEFNAKLWIYFLVVGVVVALCAFILYQDTKDWRDEKKEAK